MPKKLQAEEILGAYFRWRLLLRDGVYQADGRSNPLNAGRHSLGTKYREEAVRQLKRLDLVRAVQLGLASPALLNVEENSQDLLELDRGRELYLEFVGRPLVLGGAGPSTKKRYRAVLDKFIPFAREEGIRYWQNVTKKVAENYGAWLDGESYAYATEYLELTTLKQIIKWMAGAGHLPKTCVFDLRLSKPGKTTTYCYTLAEFTAMVQHCRQSPFCDWLGDVIETLGLTGLRISELAGLRPSDVSLNADGGYLHLADESRQGDRAARDVARTTKSHRDRRLPIHENLRPIIERKLKNGISNLFHGPCGGRLKPDTVRNALIRDVLKPLASKFPAAPGKKGFANGRLHSFRHFFCSFSASRSVSELAVMEWLGHRDSDMVRHYYHLHDDVAKEQMSRLKIEGNPGGNGPTRGS